eukprot:10329017-Lingulodinium_polyedra.AAC.1
MAAAHCANFQTDPSRFIALGLHGDGVPHQHRKSIEVLSWNVLSAGMDERFPFAVLEKDYLC